MKVLFIINECNPEWSSVPLLAYRFFDEISKLVDVTLVTHVRNKQALEKVRGGRDVFYISENRSSSIYYKIIGKILMGRGGNWPLYHTLTYPIYSEFNQKVHRQFKDQVLSGRYDIIHALTPILPRYSYKIINACKHSRFVLGPVNGGLPFPKQFGEVARKEFAGFNFLRVFSRLQPGYRKTYQQADKVLAGSSYTYEYLEKEFSLSSKTLQLFFENGILKEFISEKSVRKTDFERDIIRLLFVGRLVPYKGADMVLSAISRLHSPLKSRIRFTIVGDGTEMPHLQKQAAALGLTDHVEFAGWVDQRATLEFYRKSDIFCFPSVREFGGAVVLEAMASGLPCIVTNYGGISEYVTDETGFKIDPRSREYIVSELTNKIQLLAENHTLRRQLSENAVCHSKCFEWGNKAKQMVDLYQGLIDDKK